MALTFASYAAPDGWSRPVAVAAVLALTAVNYRGVTRTARLTRVIVTVVLLALAVVVLASLVSGQPRAGRITDDLLGAGWYGILQSAGLLFFAFAGYARIATMGEEVREPRRTIPRAIVLALTIALLLYVGVAVSILAVLGADGVASTAAPLAAAVDAGSWLWAGPVVRVGGLPPRSARCSPSSPGSGGPAWPWPATATCRAGCRPCTRCPAYRITPKSYWA
jgi:APA family basic amino acid/polyamine antiporter